MAHKITLKDGKSFTAALHGIDQGGVLVYLGEAGQHFLAPGEWTRADPVSSATTAMPASIATPGSERIGTTDF